MHHSPPKDVQVYPLEENFVIAQTARYRMFVLNATAYRIWCDYVAGKDADEIARELHKDFRVPLETARRDVQTTIDQWCEHKLLSHPEPKALLPMSESLAMPANRKGSQVNDPIIAAQTYRIGPLVFSIRHHTPELQTFVGPLLSSIVFDSAEKCDHFIDIHKISGNFIVFKDHQEVGHTGQEHLAMSLILEAIVYLSYPQVQWTAFIHASAAAKDDAGVIFCGSSGSGKSTLTAALLKSGWTYCCDDVVPLDSHCFLRTLPFNICLKSKSWQALQPQYPEITQLALYQRYGQSVRYLPIPADAGNSPKKKRVAFLVFPRFSPEEKVHLERISATAALQELIAAQTWVSPMPQHTGAFIQWIGKTPAYSLSYQDLNQAIMRLHGLVKK